MQKIVSRAASVFSTSRGASASVFAEAAAENEITPAEFNNYRRMFKTFDTNRSGTINVDELGEVMKFIGAEMNRDDLEALVDAMDRDGKKGLNFPEFLNLMVRHKERYRDQAQEKTRQSDQHIKKVLSSKCFRPDDPWKWLWDCLVMIISLYYNIVVPLLDVWQFNIGIGHNETLEFGMLVPIEVIWTLILIIDVCINFNVAYVDNMKLIVDRKLILKNYLGRYFMIDILTAIPLDLIFRAANRPIEAEICYHFRLFRILKIHRMFQRTNSGLMSTRYAHFHFGNVPIIRGFYWSVTCLHLMCIFRLFLTLPAGGYDWPEDTSVDFTGKVHSARPNAISFSAYITSLYYVLYTVTGVGYGDIEVVSTGEKAYACFLFVAGALLNGFIVGTVSTMLQQSDLASGRRQQMRETLAVLEYFDIPDNLQQEILGFQYHILEHNLSVTYANVLEGLPTTMQEELKMYIKIKFISSVPMFQTAHKDCKIALARSLENVIVPPEEFIMCVGEEGNEMYFLGHGFADVILRGGKYIATLQKGAFFGEAALLHSEKQKRNATIKALTYCDLYKLERGSFVSILNRFPKFREDIQAEAAKRQPPPAAKPAPAPAPSLPPPTGPPNESGGPPNNNTGNTSSRRGTNNLQQPGENAPIPTKTSSIILAGGRLSSKTPSMIGSPKHAFEMERKGSQKQQQAPFSGRKSANLSPFVKQPSIHGKPSVPGINIGNKMDRTSSSGFRGAVWNSSSENNNNNSNNLTTMIVVEPSSDPGGGSPAMIASTATGSLPKAELSTVRSMEPYETEALPSPTAKCTMGKLRIKVLRASSLAPNPMHPRDPMVILTIGKRQATTTTAKITLNPVWNETFVMDVEIRPTSPNADLPIGVMVSKHHLQIDVLDKHGASSMMPPGGDDMDSSPSLSAAEGRVDLHRLRQGVKMEHTVSLIPQGELALTLEALDFGLPATYSSSTLVDIPRPVIGPMMGLDSSPNLPNLFQNHQDRVLVISPPTTDPGSGIGGAAPGGGEVIIEEIETIAEADEEDSPVQEVGSNAQIFGGNSVIQPNPPIASAGLSESYLGTSSLQIAQASMQSVSSRKPIDIGMPPTSSEFALGQPIISPPLPPPPPQASPGSLPPHPPPPPPRMSPDDGIMLNVPAFLPTPSMTISGAAGAASYRSGQSGSSEIPIATQQPQQPSPPPPAPVYGSGVARAITTDTDASSTVVTVSGPDVAHWSSSGKLKSSNHDNSGTRVPGGAAISSSSTFSPGPPTTTTGSNQLTPSARSTHGGGGGIGSSSDSPPPPPHTGTTQVSSQETQALNDRMKRLEHEMEELRMILHSGFRQLEHVLDAVKGTNTSRKGSHLAPFSPFK